MVRRVFRRRRSRRRRHEAESPATRCDFHDDADDHRNHNECDDNDSRHDRSRNTAVGRPIALLATRQWRRRRRNFVYFRYFRLVVATTWQHLCLSFDRNRKRAMLISVGMSTGSRRCRQRRLEKNDGRVCGVKLFLRRTRNTILVILQHRQLR